MNTQATHHDAALAHSGTGSNGHRRISADELGRRRDQRAQGRAERRKAVR